MKRRGEMAWVCLCVLAAVAAAGSAGAQVDTSLCSATNTVTANVVAINQPITMNRLGAAIPGGMMFALARDVCAPGSGGQCGTGAPSAGHVMLRPDKRPRPMVLRVNQGQCLEIRFTNLLDPSGNQNNTVSSPNPTTAAAAPHVQGLNWVGSAADDGSFVGQNANSLVEPLSGPFNPANPQATYTLFAEHEGPHVLYSTGDDYTKVAPGDGGQLQVGLFGAVIVEPSGSEWYRSQVTHADLQCAADNAFGPDAFPKISNYKKTFPTSSSDPCYDPAKAGVPILGMLCTASSANCQANEIVYSDLTALVTGPNAGDFPDVDLGQRPPDQRPAYSYPDRLQPFREFTIIYHETYQVNQAFSYYYQGNGGGGAPGKTGLPTLGSVGDNFGINYAFNALGSPILANRLQLGALAQCTDCKYEEFFLSSWTAGDPAMIVDNPATNCVSATTGQKTPTCPAATKALYPDDPSNVYHSYMSDHLKFRILHGGVDLHHLHHQHAHQWLASPSSPRGDYLDSQSIGPGSAFTLEMVYNGSGNVNQTVGDSIFHCHFYPHFASGMWGLWRVHDVFEAGTELDADGKPAMDSRALPDGEIAAGTPIPALVPIPTLPMAPLPAPVKLVSQSGKPGSQVMVQLVTQLGQNGPWVSPLQGDPSYNPLSPPSDQDLLSPGYPFFIPGVAGSRAPHPPLDFAYACTDNGKICESPVFGQGGDTSQCGSPDLCQPLNGGLARNVMDRTDQSQSTRYLDPTAVADNQGNPTPVQAFADADFSKKILKAGATQLDEQGTLVERVAMKTHAQRFHNTPTPAGSPGQFILNGLPPQPGAPYADPCIQFTRDGGPATEALDNRYLAVDLQLDAVFNKAGWHFPQQRILTLWGDAYDTLQGTRPPEPLFLRANSYDCLEYVFANLVPNVYELDDFQVRTPTDVLGQHIHLVKFDVTSSDGAANGWNYEDGTFAPNEVTERIDAIRAANACTPTDPVSFRCPKADYIKFFGEGPVAGNKSWLGSQATVQRWYDDPLLDNFGHCSNDLARACRTSDPSSCPGGECWASAGFCSNDPLAPCNVGDAQCVVPGICIPAYDRTIRTIFTHDHFSPSTHQQTGLYAGVVVEPRGSQWLDNQTGTVMGGFDPTTGKNFQGTRVATFNNTGVQVLDGGPTSWQAVIAMPDGSPGRDQLSFREFLLEFQDSALFYQPFTVAPNPFESQNEGFCSYTGVCVDSSGTVQRSGGDPLRCVVVPPNLHTIGKPPGPPANMCASGDECILVYDYLRECSPDDPDFMTLCAKNLPTYTDANGHSQPYPQSCNLLTGVPSTSWLFAAAQDNTTGSTNVTGTAPGEYIDFKYKGIETITFQNASYNFSVNYRTEPFYPRMTDSQGNLLGGAYGDLGYVYSSLKFCTGSSTPCTSNADCSSGTCDDRPNRSDPYPAPLTPGVAPNDPFTPLLRAYAGDDVQIRTLVGAHINPHNFTLHDMNWMMEPSFVDSGWRNSQVMGISEHFELLLQVPPIFSQQQGNDWGDYLYKVGAADLEQAGGNWGLLRAYNALQKDAYGHSTLWPLPQNPGDAGFPKRSVCPGQPDVAFEVVALNATVTYNQVQNQTDTNAIVLLNVNDPNLGCSDPANPSTCTSYSGNPVPLVLRAAAGDCIQVTLYNNLTASTTTGVPFTPIPNTNHQANTTISQQLGLRPQLVTYDPHSGDGTNAGFNPIQTVGPGKNNAHNPYVWYAGNIDPRGQNPYIPIEFGTANLLPPDPLNHPVHEMFAGLVIEPQGSAAVVADGSGGWQVVPWTDAGATGPEAVISENGQADGKKFREFAIFIQDSTNMPPGKLNAVNFRAEKLSLNNSPSRFCDSQCTNTTDFSCVFTGQAYCNNSGTCEPCSMFYANQSLTFPETPTFQACAGEEVRFRLFHPGGTNTDEVFELYGHSFSEAPYQTPAPYCQGPQEVTASNATLASTNLYLGLQHTNLRASQSIGVESLCGSTEWLVQFPPLTSDKWSESLNEWKGSRMGHGPSNHYDALIARAGGCNQVSGDYLYRSYPADHFNLGVWGIFRVLDRTSAGAFTCIPESQYPLPPSSTCP